MIFLNSPADTIITMSLEFGTSGVVTGHTALTVVSDGLKAIEATESNAAAHEAMKTHVCHDADMVSVWLLQLAVVHIPACPFACDHIRG